MYVHAHDDQCFVLLGKKSAIDWTTPGASGRLELR
jgi:hypothetical protein